MLRGTRPIARRALSTWVAGGVPTGSVSTLHELGVAAGETYGDLKSLGVRDAGSGEWKWTTFAERVERARRLGNVLADAGVSRGDRVAVISKNREEFATTMYGAYAAGAAHVPMYEQQKPEEWEYILNDSEAKVLFVSREALVEDAVRVAPAGARVLCFEDTADGSSANFEAALEYGATLDDGRAAAQRPEASDLASLIYTSGTTGEPKGVELTHGNLVWNALTMRDLMTQELDAIGIETEIKLRSLAILPWAHIYGQTIELHGMTAAGHEVAVATDPTTFLAEVGEAKPDCLFAVPALYNRIYDGFQQSKRALSPAKAGLADKAVALGLKKMRSRCVNFANPPLGLVESLQHAVLDKIVLSKIRDKLGGNVLFVGNGGAAISGEVRDFLDALNLPVTNGYGLTETSPCLSKEQPLDKNNYLPGSVGRALPGVDLRVLDGDGNECAAGEPGELVGSGPGVMRGYWKNEAATSEVLFEEHGKTWFRTGDQCVIEADGHVRIVGRIKEQYKLDNGKYVVPTPLEEQLARSRYIAQAFLFGDNKPHNVVLVAPDWAAVSEEIGDGDVTMVAPFTYEPQSAIDALAASKAEEIRSMIEAELDAHTAKFKAFEKPQGFSVVPVGFNAGRGMVTPKMSVKRATVLAAHGDDIEAIYAASA